MAVSYIAAAGTNAIPSNPSTTGITVTHGFSLQNGDILVAFVAMGDDDPSAFTSSSGGTWSNDTTNLFASSSIGNDIALGVLWRVVTNAAGEPSTYTFLATGATSQQTLVAQVIQVRGGSTSSVRDGNGYAARGNNDFTPTHSNYDTSQDNSLLLIAHAASMADGTTGKSAGKPSTATSLTSPGSQYQEDTASTAGYDIFIETAYQTTTTLGTQTIDSWNGTPDDSASEWGIATIAIREKTSVTGATTSAYTLTETSSAKLTAKSATTSAYTASEVTSGRLGAKGATTAAYTASLTTAGTRALRGLVAFPVTLDEVTQATNVLRGIVDAPLAWDAVTDGDIAGGGTDWYGATSLPLAYGSTTSGWAMASAHPLLDAVDGAWTDQDGGHFLANALDEETPSDADYIRSELNPVDSACRVKLEPLVDPGVDFKHRLNWRIAKSAADGATVDMEMRLYEGGALVLGAGTLIASFTRLDVSEEFTTYAESLSEAEAASIGNYSNLYLELEATVA